VSGNVRGWINKQTLKGASLTGRKMKQRRRDEKEGKERDLSSPIAAKLRAFPVTQEFSRSLKPQ